MGFHRFYSTYVDLGIKHRWFQSNNKKIRWTNVTIMESHDVTFQGTVLLYVEYGLYACE